MSRISTPTKERNSNLDMNNTKIVNVKKIQNRVHVLEDAKL